jgi:hypothetical protein
VSFSFETIGWEVLGVVLILLLIATTWLWVRSYRRNAYRRAALRQLELYRQGSWNVQDVLLLLKKSAIHAYGRSHTGNLFGHDWLAFLDGSAKDVQLLKLEQEIAAAVYQNRSLSPEASHDLLVNARNWIKTHARKS